MALHVAILTLHHQGSPLSPKAPPPLLLPVCLLQAVAADVPLHGREPIDAAEIFEHIRDITDPEHPYSLEQLNVVEEELISVDDSAGHVK